MEINTEIKGKIDKEEVKDILQEYLKSKGYDVTNIWFDVTMEQDEDDYLLINQLFIFDKSKILS